MMPLKTTLRLKNRLVLVLIAIILILLVLESYRGWFVLLIGLGGAFLLAYGWVRSLAKGLSFSRKMRFGWAQVGDRLEERFHLTNNGLVPGLWIEVDYHSTMPDYQPRRVSSVGGSGATSEWQTGGTCTRRGVFTLGPVVLRTGDPFGFYELILEHPTTNTILVTPPVIPLPEIEVAPGGRMGGGQQRRYAPEESVSVSSVREYTPGDSLRMIHWLTTVRREKFFVRTLDTVPASDWWIFLDLDKRFRFGEGYENTEEHGIILAASLADHGLRSGHPVGLVTFGAELAWLPPRYGEEHRQSILRELALASPGETSLDQLLELARPVFRQNPSLILITSNTHLGWVNALIPLLARGIVPTVLLLDPSSYAQDSSIQVFPAGALFGLLEELGITRYSLPREFFDRPEIRPGQQGVWDWKKTASSRATLAAKPGDLAWTEL